MRSLTVIGALALAFVGANASADILDKLKKAVEPPSLEEQDWIEVRTPNFRVRSTLDEKEASKLARHIEKVSAVFAAVLGSSFEDTPIPVDIIALKDSHGFEQLGINPSMGGFFRPGLRRHTILVHDTNGHIDELELLARQYAYFLLGDHGAANYPQWFKDGFAEMLSTVREKSGVFVIGGQPEHLVANLGYWQWAPIRQILDRKSYAEIGSRYPGLFHAEAWALVHFLYHRPERDTLDRDMARYIELLDAGQEDLIAFESAFGITLEKLDNQLRAYLRWDEIPYIYAVDSDSVDDVTGHEPEVTDLSSEQVSLMLGRIALSQRKLGEAQHWFTLATGATDTRPQAKAGLGEVYMLAGYVEAAEPYFDSAVSLAPEDPYCQLDLGKYWHDRAKYSDDADGRANYLALARKHYIQAWKLDDSKPETYVLYGQTFLTEGENYDKAIEMLEFAEALLPSNLTVRAMLAQAYFEAGRREDAIKAAHSVQVWSHEASNAARLAGELLANATPESERNYQSIN